MVREVGEESGVVVDYSSARYHSSQPWPFPQSLMIGFVAEAPPADAISQQGDGSAAPGGMQQRGLDLLSGEGRRAAQEVGLTAAEVERYMLPQLQAVQVDTNELEDARWFHLEWLEAVLGTGADNFPLLPIPGASAAEPFRIPGR